MNSDGHVDRNALPHRGQSRVVSLASVAACTALFLSAGRASGQCPTRSSGRDVDAKVSYFLDDSRILYALPYKKLVPADSGLLFEAQIAPNFFLFQNVAQKAQCVFETTGWVPAVSIALTPMVRLRQTLSWSKPVRTPSYMPKATFQLFMMHQRDTSSSGNQRLSIVIVQGVVGHHSNGQNGCLYEGYVALTSEGTTECAPKEGADTLQRVINREDGSFSTNYVQIGVFGKALVEDDNNEFKSSIGGGVQLEVNPRGWMDPLIADLYGRTRLRGTVEYVDSMPRVFGHRLPGRGRVEATFERIFQADPMVKNYNASLEADWAFPQSAEWLGGYGVFVRLYRGQDYYNLGFLTGISVVQFGLIASNVRFGSFPFPRKIQ